MTAMGGQPMSAPQKRAIADLEAALLRCARAGIVFCGMDAEILAYRTVDLERAVTLYGGHHAAQVALADVAVTVDDHGTYRESGGF